jgi:hypothetical protein
MPHPVDGAKVSQSQIDITSGEVPRSQQIVDDYINELARMADDVDTWGDEATDYIYKQNTTIGNWLVGNPVYNKLFANGETVMASHGQWGQEGIRAFRNWRAADNLFKAEFSQDLKYFQDNPDALRLAETEVASFNEAAGTRLSDNGALYKKILDGARNMVNEKGGDIKYLYNYIPNPLDPKQKAAFSQWITDNEAALGDTFKNFQEKFLKVNDFDMADPKSSLSRTH